jgi:signal peptidase I
MKSPTDKFELVLKRALSLRETDGVFGIEVATVREAEFLLQLVLSVKPGDLLRKRVYAVALLEPSGLNVKRAGEDWLTLGQLNGPAVLLIPSGISSRVASAKRISWGKEPPSWRARVGCVALLLLLLLFAIRSVVFDWYQQSSDSMLPTIAPGTTGIAVLKCAYLLRLPFTSVHVLRMGAPARGEVVALRDPHGKPQIMRVVGLPGDIIEMRDQVLVINTVRSRIPPNPAPSSVRGEADLKFALRDFGPITVPPDMVFVLNDNRGDSRDSRLFGPVPLSDLLGRVVNIPKRP